MISSIWLWDAEHKQTWLAATHGWFHFQRFSCGCNVAIAKAECIALPLESYRHEPGVRFIVWNGKGVFPQRRVTHLYLTCWMMNTIPFPFYNLGVLRDVEHALLKQTRVILFISSWVSVTDGFRVFEMITSNTVVVNSCGAVPNPRPPFVSKVFENSCKEKLERKRPRSAAPSPLFAAISISMNTFIGIVKVYMDAPPPHPLPGNAISL